ncbi:MAG: hypothetical protein ONA69_04025 [candidate division KSB1 bacterium]|nr:hypothetical protein [candidate division KSB1 bacterium]MDZ7345941.1 hypothetical protein [candidate division KSB1 bacterium]
MDAMPSAAHEEALGRQLTSWIYRAERSRTFLAYLIGLLGAAIVFFLLYGRHFIPTAGKISEILIYLVLFGIGPLLNLLKAVGKDRQYDLYENGFVISILDKNKVESSTIGYWRDYRTCYYRPHEVILLGESRFVRKKLLVPANAVAIYSICREQINAAQMNRLKEQRPIEAPNSEEQRRLRSFEKRRLGDSYGSRPKPIE